jgi:copper chaperone
MSLTHPPTPYSPPAPVTATFQVTGIACAQCMHAVTSEINQIETVTAVTVDPSTGQVVVVSDQPIDTAAVAAAVNEAGCQLT